MAKKKQDDNKGVFKVTVTNDEDGREFAVHVDATDNDGAGDEALKVMKETPGMFGKGPFTVKQVEAEAQIG